MANLNIEIKILTPTKENIKDCERIRYDSIEQYIPEEYLDRSSCADRIKDAELLMFGLYLDGLLAAGCYVGDYFDTLFIDQLFVKKEFQETGLYLGRTLLEHVLENRKDIEKFFNYHPTKSQLFFLDDKSKRLYEKLGFEIENSAISLMSKKL